MAQGFDVTECVGQLQKVQGFDHYNRLIDINRIFSTSPRGEPVDRTGRIIGPYNFAVPRPWRPPGPAQDLDTVFGNRVRELCDLKQPVNVFWSGGVDSTTIMTAFLKHAPDLAQCRVIYSPWSTYEHPEYFRMLSQISGLDMIDVSGDRYLDLDLDGIFVSGNPGDEMHASLDQSFYEQHGSQLRQKAWLDLFWEQTGDSGFLEWCLDFYSHAGREIRTVLEARWWFYITCKLWAMHGMVDLGLLCSSPERFNAERSIGFFDCDQYESFVYHNLHRLLETEEYAGWRQFLKDYCHSHDGFADWQQDKTKFNSGQLMIYGKKKQILNNTRYLLLLDDGQRVATEHLPLFSQGEWQKIKSDYGYLFNQPGTLQRSMA